MTERDYEPRTRLAGKFVLVVEDEPLIALDLAAIFEDEDALVVGPAATVRDALTLLRASSVDVAVLDVSLGREDVTPVAKALIERGVPMIFHTGAGPSAAALGQFAAAPVLQKPSSPRHLVRTVEQALARSPGIRVAPALSP